MKNILIIEDDKKIRRFLQLELEHEGYGVSTAQDGSEGMQKFLEGNFDLILLDLMLPKISGEEICKKIRENFSVPIIVLTAKDQISNKVELLDMGADDYLTKPFFIEELFARMRVFFRNNNNVEKNNKLIYDDLILDLKSNILYKNDRLISLTRTEYDLVHCFLINKELILSREKILLEVWGYDYEGNENIVDVYINFLRKKIDTKEKKHIHTIVGFGYMLKVK
jgi:DNA-binding response OmpR family regulator